MRKSWARTATPLRRHLVCPARRGILDGHAHSPADHGFRVGERIPGVVEVGTLYGDGKKLFAAVHHKTPRGLRITFEGAKYEEWIVGCEDPESVASELSLPR